MKEQIKDFFIKEEQCIICEVLELRLEFISENAAQYTKEFLQLGMNLTFVEEGNVLIISPAKEDYLYLGVIDQFSWEKRVLIPKFPLLLATKVCYMNIDLPKSIFRTPHVRDLIWGNGTKMQNKEREEMIRIAQKAGEVFVLLE
ncbi:MAG: hypothetical protein ACKUBY_02155 [Candidatus Moraniibacteriota bacterium]|jgi:hypothetical protein